MIYKHDEEAQHKNKFDLGKKQASLHCLICLLRIKNSHFTDIYHLSRDSFIPIGTDLNFFYDFFKIANLRFRPLGGKLFVLFVLLLAVFSDFQPRHSSADHPTFLSDNQVMTPRRFLDEFQDHCQTFIGTFHFENEPAL